MDKPTAKQLLSAYRPEGQDSNDPELREALALCQQDSELRKWLEDEMATDRGMAHALGAITAPEAGLEAVLNLHKVSPAQRSFLQRALPWGGLAAAAILMFALVQLFQSPEPAVVVAAKPSACLSEIAHLADTAMPLDFYNKSLPSITDWLDTRQAPALVELPEPLASASSNGCRVLLDVEGNAVSLICMQLEGERLHIMVMNDDTSLARALPKEAWNEAGGWNQYAWNSGGQTYVIVSQKPLTSLRAKLTPA